MLTFTSRLLLFLSAFAPLFFIWALRTWPSGVAWVFVAFVAVGVAGTALVIIVARRDEGETIRLTSVEARQSDTAAYVVTYLIPFVTAPLVSAQDWIAVGAFLFLLLALYITSDLLSVNPLLALAGLRLYRVEFDGSRNAWLLAGRPTEGSEMAVAQLWETVYVAVRGA